MLRRLLPSSVGVICATLALAASAAAQGVIVDPDSPAGQEYAIPLDTARNDAGGGGHASAGAGGGTQGTQPAPAFGVGVTPEGKSGTGAAPSNGRSGGEQATRRHKKRTSGDAGTAATSRSASLSSVSESTSSSLLWSGLAAAIVLLGGLGAGIGLRQTRRA